jgi:hypothetical protein
VYGYRILIGIGDTLLTRGLVDVCVFVLLSILLEWGWKVDVVLACDLYRFPVRNTPALSIVSIHARSVVKELQNR